MLTEVSTCRKLISRWMWNVNAVVEWTARQDGRDDHPDWWQQSKEDAYKRSPGQQSEEDTSIESTGQTQDRAQLPCFDRYISEFVGQGRQIGYNGLAYAVLGSVYDTPNDNRRVQQLDVIVKQTLKRLNGRRPGSWWVLSLISLAIVWLEIGMAFMISYNVPTVGIGCRSMSYLIYGGLSTLPWIIQLLPWFKHPGAKRKAACYLICLLSTLCLIFVTFAAVS
jgi:hypothetical protein